MSKAEKIHFLKENHTNWLSNTKHLALKTFIERSNIIVGIQTQDKQLRYILTYQVRHGLHVLPASLSPYLPTQPSDPAQRLILPYPRLPEYIFYIIQTFCSLLPSLFSPALAFSFSLNVHALSFSSLLSLSFSP